MLAVRGPQQGAPGGAGGIHQPLKLQGGDHVRALLVGILPEFLQGDGLEAGSGHNGAVLPLLQPVGLLVVDGPGGTHLGAYPAFAGVQLGAVGRVDGGNLGHRLGKGDVNGPAVVQAQVEGVGYPLLGTFLGTQAAAGALGGVYIPGLVPDGDGEVAHEALHLLHLGIGQNVDVFILGRIHHFRGENTGGAVQSGEGLVDLGHFPADGRLLLHNVHREARLGNIQGGLNPGDTAADDQGALGHRTLPGGEGGVQLHLGNGRPAQDNGLFRGHLPVLVNPGALLPDIGNFHQVGVQPRSGGSLPEGGLMHPGGAGADHHPGEFVLANGLNQQILAGLGAHILIVRGIDHPRLPAQGLGHRLDVHGGGNVGAAPADKYADSTHLPSPHFPYFRRALTSACWGISGSNRPGI